MKRVRIVHDDSPESPREWDNMGKMACWHRRYNLGDEQPDTDQEQWLRDLAIEKNPRLGEIIESWENESWEWLRDLRESRGQDSSWEAMNEILGGHVASLVDAVMVPNYVVLPVYIYDHSGITLNTTGFSCPWDSGQVGWIVCDLDKARECFMLGKTVPTDDNPYNFVPDETTTWDTPIKYPRQDDPSQLEEVTLREATKRNLRIEVETYSQYIQGDIYGFIVEERESEDDEWEEKDSCWGFYGSDPRKNGMDGHLDEEEVELAAGAEVEYSH
jgi:hypothetical protein